MLAGLVANNSLVVLFGRIDAFLMVHIFPGFVS
jgi:hypothetical protein